MKNILLFLSLSLLLLSCGGGLSYEALPFPSGSQQAIDNGLITSYLVKNKIEAKNTASGIYYTIEKEGSGENPNLQSFVKVHYHGTLLDGTVFDSSVDRGQPIDFPLTGVVKGWQEGIPLFKPGGKGTLYIPSNLAYGGRAQGKIPANSVLIFNVELLEVIDPAVQAKKDDEILAKFVSDNKLTMQKTDSGIYYQIDAPGTGESPTVSNKVKVHYRGTLLDGTQFDSSYDRGEPIEFPLSGVIKGWQESVPLLKKSGKGKFLIPSGLAYGTRGAPPTIPGNACLVFEVELLDFQ